MRPESRCMNVRDASHSTNWSTHSDEPLRPFETRHLGVHPTSNSSLQINLTFAYRQYYLAANVLFGTLVPASLFQHSVASTYQLTASPEIYMVLLTKL